jgi:hypothetical protein
MNGTTHNPTLGTFAALLKPGRKKGDGVRCHGALKRRREKAGVDPLEHAWHLIDWDTNKVMDGMTMMTTGEARRRNAYNRNFSPLLRLEWQMIRKTVL